MNPWLIIGLIVIFGGGCTGAYLKGESDGRAHEIVKQTAVEDVMAATYAAATDAAASAIANIQVKQVTIKGRVEREVQTHTIYGDCHHSPDGLRNLNDALTNVDSSGPVGGSQLPSSAATR